MAPSRSKKSTNGRANWSQRTYLRVSERLAPDRAARLLSKMWFRLPAPPETRLRGNAPADATTFTLDTDEGQVWGYDWGEGPLVYAFHGWAGSSHDLNHISATLRANGMRVIAFDATSHGNSESGPWGDRYSSAMHMVGAGRAVMKKFGPPDALLTHSLGCLTAPLAYKELYETPVSVPTVMMAPFVGGADAFAGTLNSVVPVGPRIMERVLPLLQKRAGVPLADYTLSDHQPDAPVLVIHDRGDRPNPFAFGQELVDQWPIATMHATSGLGHRRILSCPETVGVARRFITDHVASGRH